MKICIVGSVGDNSVTCSGQILRTRVLKEYLEKEYGKENVIVVNTNDYKRNALKITISLFFSLVRCKVYIVMLSRNGRRVIYPIMHLYKRVFKKHVFNNVIGGGYAESIADNPKLIKYTKSFDVNWVQSQSMLDNLNKIDVHNVEVLPNSKPQRISEMISDRSANASNRFIFCTFSRVMKDKGIEDAIKAVELANATRGKNDIFLWIYGSVESNYQEQFEQVINISSKNIEYKGYVSPEETTDVLEKCYALLFPTVWSGEGFPGTVLDGFAAGLPVFATDWNCNAEVISNGLTGGIYDVSDKDALKNYILWAVENENEIDKMRRNCVVEAERYTPENVMPIIFSKINQC